MVWEVIVQSFSPNGPRVPDLQKFEVEFNVLSTYVRTYVCYVRTYVRMYVRTSLSTRSTKLERAMKLKFGILVAIIGGMMAF